MAYAPPVGYKAALLFPAGAYVPPNGSAAALDFLGSSDPGDDTRFVLPASWDASAYGAPQVRSTRITPSGWDKRKKIYRTYNGVVNFTKNQQMLAQDEADNANDKIFCHNILIPLEDFDSTATSTTTSTTTGTGTTVTTQ